MVILDIDSLTLLLRGKGADAERLKLRIAPLPIEEKATTIITYEEQTRGWLAYVGKCQTQVQQVDAYRKLKRHLEDFCGILALEFDENAAVKFQELQRSLRIGTMGLKIAAITLVRDALLLSRNLRDFRQAPGLKVEDWTI